MATSRADFKGTVLSRNIRNSDGDADADSPAEQSPLRVQIHGRGGPAEA
jgi:hypothetical protein